MNLYEFEYNDLIKRDLAMKTIVGWLVRYSGLTPSEAIRFVLWLD